MESNTEFVGTIFKEPTSGWTCIEWPGSHEFLGTGKAAKVVCSVDEMELAVTVMPTGKGHHMIPLKQDVRKKLKRDIGDTVDVKIIGRQ